MSAVTKSAPAPPKKQVTEGHAQIVSYFLKDFDAKMRESFEKGHHYVIVNSVHTTCKDLFMDKRLVIYILMGKYADWGSIKENYGVAPASQVICDAVVARGEELYSDMAFSASFVDSFSKNGDFRLKVDYKPTGDKPVEEKEPESPAEAVIRRVTVKPKENSYAAKVAKSAPNTPAPVAVRAKSPATKRATTAKDERIDELSSEIQELKKLLKELALAKAAAATSAPAENAASE